MCGIYKKEGAGDFGMCLDCGAVNLFGKAQYRLVQLGGCRCACVCDTDRYDNHARFSEAFVGREYEAGRYLYFKKDFAMGGNYSRLQP